MHSSYGNERLLKGPCPIRARPVVKRSKDGGFKRKKMGIYSRTLIQMNHSSPWDFSHLEVWHGSSFWLKWREIGGSPSGSEAIVNPLLVVRLLHTQSRKPTSPSCPRRRPFGRANLTSGPDPQLPDTNTWKV